MKRTLTHQTTQKVGTKIKLQGWVDTKRDHGKITFIDLRDRSGKVQCVGYQKMGEVSTESVVEIIGEVKQRPENMVNKELQTGTVEVDVQEYTVLNDVAELPIPIDTEGKDIKEEVRLRYRYLDLRRERMQKTIKLRSNVIRAMREALYKQDFVEIETPMLTKSTKEGARDFIVPSRFQPGKFYALPQSPQQYKQLLMTAGFERYFQVARCVRDEDLRADRGFEFTQFDLEMSFPQNKEDIMSLVEDVVKQSVKSVGGKLQKEKFPVITYKEALKKYGADKFDLRTEKEKKQGVLAFAWVVDFPFFKKVDTSDMAEVRDGKSGWTFTHNPFSTPEPEYLEDHLTKQNIGDIVTAQYDLVCNGFEIGGGSIRAHDPKVLRTTFEIMGYSDQEIEESIGHMLEAFTMGTPPHGGIALGLDRLVMLLANETSLKEAIAFPMTSTGRTAVMDAPDSVSEDQLIELGLSIRTQTQSPHDFILDLLKSQHIKYEYKKHEPVFTSEEAAKVRGDTLHQGAKALVLQADGEYILLVVPGDMRADLKAVKKYLNVKKLEMAKPDDIEKRTGLKIGSIPPFGSSMNMPTYVDVRLFDNKKISFNVGRHDRSITMRYVDFLKVENPEVVDV